MSLPEGVQTVTVTGAFASPSDAASPISGRVIFTPSVSRVISAEDGVIAVGPVTVTLDASGAFSVDLLATDAEGFSPSGWTYGVFELIAGEVSRAYDVALPAAAPTADLSSLAPVSASDGTVVQLPPTVTSVDGLTGAVDLTGRYLQQAGADTRYGQLAAANAWTGSQSLGSTTPEKSTTVTLSSGGRPLFVKTTSTYDHALTSYLAGGQTPPPSGGGYNPTQFNNSAINAVSENSQNSAMFLSGVETGRGTLKIAHKGYADGADSNAAAISIDLQTDYNTPGDTTTPVAGTKGTKARGIFVTSTTDASTTGVLGDAVAVRFTTGLDDFRVTGAGKTILGSAIGSTPLGRLDVRQGDDATVGLFLKPNSANASDLVQVQDSTGALKISVDKTGQAIFRRNVYSTLGVQVGGTSATFGGGSGVLGLTDASTAPTTNPSGGLVVYSQAGTLKYRNPSGVVVTLDGSASSDVRPARQGLLGWSLDPGAAVNGTALTAGQETLIRVVAEAAGTVGHVTLGLTNTPAGCANSFVGIRDASGTLLGSTADASATLNSSAAGKLTLALAAGVSVTQGAAYYVVVVVGSATTLPSLSRGASNGVINDGLAAGAYRTMTAGASLTALPASVTMSGAGQSSTAYYASMSV